jgi:hypothetical protein
MDKYFEYQKKYKNRAHALKIRETERSEVMIFSPQ